MPIRINDIVHVSHPGKWYDNLFCLVEKVQAWGVVGVIRLAQGDAPIRLSWNEINAVYRKVQDN